MDSKAKLGQNGPLINRIGYGAMVLEGYYGQIEEEKAIETLRYALQKEMMIDTADAYGAGRNELLLAKAISESETKPFIASKFGIVYEEGREGTVINTGWGFPLTLNTSANYMRESLDKSLERLGVDCIDLYYAHYIDPKTPIEETVAAMAEAKKLGKINHIGLSNATADEIRRAHAVSPIAAVQYEYSMWRRQPEKDLLPTLKELGIALVSWSPLGGGFLSGEVKELDARDFRNTNPRYSGENLNKNLDRFEPLREIAGGLGITCAQLALSWLMHQGPQIFAIPGTRYLERIDENLQSTDFGLGPDLLGEMDRMLTDDLALGGTLL